MCLFWVNLKGLSIPDMPTPLSSVTALANGFQVSQLGGEGLQVYWNVKQEQESCLHMEPDYKANIFCISWRYWEKNPKQRTPTLHPPDWSACINPYLRTHPCIDDLIIYSLLLGLFVGEKKFKIRLFFKQCIGHHPHASGVPLISTIPF